jgi:hypothetical protein
VATCNAAGNVINGTSCGSGSVCFDGGCTACDQDAACDLPDAACKTGAIQCGTGQATCVASGDWPDETLCSVGICCSGACVACGTTPPNETPTCATGACTFKCAGGYTSCSGKCIDTTNNNKACGPLCKACGTGTICVSSSCNYVYGYSTEFQPCGDLISVLNANVLWAQRVIIPSTFTVTNLGMFGYQVTSTVHGIMALYTDVDGGPTSLVAQTASTTIQDGNNLIPVQSAATVQKGSFWIAGIFDGAGGPVCSDNSQSNILDYVTQPYGSVPSTFGKPTQVLTPDVNFYVVGTE